MELRQLQVATADGTMETVLARPAAPGAPVVIVYMDVWGIRPELVDVARDVAAAGYCAVLPDLYYRQGRVRHEFRDPDGKMITLARLSPEQQEQVRTPLRKLTDAMVIADTDALLAVLDREHGAGGRPVGTIGYCMGGRFALNAFGTTSGRVRAAASLHGTSLVTDAATSPHRIAAKGQGEIYCGFAERDPHGAPDVMAALADTFRQTGVPYRGELHLGAEHGYALPDRDIHDAAATAKDWTAIRAMLHRQLAPAA